MPRKCSFRPHMARPKIVPNQLVVRCLGFYLPVQGREVLRLTTLQAAFWLATISMYQHACCSYLTTDQTSPATFERIRLRLAKCLPWRRIHLLMAMCCFAFGASVARTSPSFRHQETGATLGRNTLSHQSCMFSTEAVDVSCQLSKLSGCRASAGVG